MHGLTKRTRIIIISVNIAAVVPAPKDLSMKALTAALATLLAAALSATAARASAVVPEFRLGITGHMFEPAALKVPAGVRFKIRITNRDATPEEFESLDLNREQIVMPGRSIVVYLGPLTAGNYRFFGDFHRDTAQGRLVVERE